MNNYSAHIMCSNQVKKCVYPVGGDIKRRKKEGVFLGVVEQHREGKWGIHG